MNRRRRVLKFLDEAYPNGVTGVKVADQVSRRWWEKPGRSRTYAILAELQREGAIEAQWYGNQRFFRLTGNLARKVPS